MNYWFWFWQLFHNKKEDKIMALLSDVQNLLTTLNTDVDAKFAAVTAKIDALKAGQGVVGATPEELDGLLGTVAAINSKVNAFDPETV